MKPALTAEEWAAVFSWRRLVKVETGRTVTDALLSTFLAADRAHAAAALALHGQRFGFTDEDRAMLFLFAETLGAHGVHESHLARCRSLARRIGALLP